MHAIGFTETVRGLILWAHGTNLRSQSRHFCLLIFNLFKQSPKFAVLGLLLLSAARLLPPLIAAVPPWTVVVVSFIVSLLVSVVLLPLLVLRFVLLFLLNLRFADGIPELLLLVLFGL